MTKIKLYETVYGESPPEISTDEYEMSIMDQMENAMNVAIQDSELNGYDNIYDYVKEMYPQYEDTPGGMTRDEKFIEDIAKNLVD
tara:strand:+ start:1295 stop:1549 length:255 start_codon:yes stop_codon:yes gene_type:complete